MADSSFVVAYDAALAEVQSRESRLTDTDAGSAFDALLAVGARGSELLEVVIIERFLAHYISEAKGDDLDTLAEDHFGITRNAAAKASATLLLSRPTFAFGEVAVAEGDVYRTDDDLADDRVEFAALSAYVLGATELSLEISVEALVAGAAGNVNADTITEAEVDLADSSITITNASAAAGGADEEGDSAFRARILAYVRNLARATVEALIVGAKEVDGIVSAAVDESDSGPLDGGLVRVFVGDLNGNASDELVASAVAELHSWRAAGVTVGVYAGTVEDVFLLRVSVRMRSADYDLGWVEKTARDAAVLASKDLASGEGLYQERIDSAVWEALGGAPVVADVSSTYEVDGGVGAEAWPAEPSSEGRALRVQSDAVLVSVSGPA